MISLAWSRSVSARTWSPSRPTTEITTSGSPGSASANDVNEAVESTSNGCMVTARPVRADMSSASRWSAGSARPAS